MSQHISQVFLTMNAADNEIDNSCPVIWDGQLTFSRPYSIYFDVLLEDDLVRSLS